MDWATILKRDPLIVLGIDPGTNALGFGVVGRQRGRLHAVDHGVVRTPRNTGIGERLVILKQALDRLLDHHAPDVVALEQAFVKNNVQSAFRIGEARAVVILAAEEHGVPVAQYPTATAKKSIAGHGGASKSIVQEMVRRHLGLSVAPSPHDATDALALALCLLFDPRMDPRLAAELGVP